jgi:hypothetical protein
MISQFGNYNLKFTHASPSYQLEEEVLHIDDDTSVESVAKFYNDNHIDGPARTRMNAAQRRQYYRSHFPKMEYKGFVFFMDGKIENFLTVREIEINAKGKIKLYKVVPGAAVTAIEMEGFDPDAPKTSKMTQLHDNNSGKQYFAGNEESTSVMKEYIPDPVLLTLTKYAYEFNQAEFVFNHISQMYTSHVV